MRRTNEQAQPDTIPRHSRKSAETAPRARSIRIHGGTAVARRENSVPRIAIQLEPRMVVMPMQARTSMSFLRSHWRVFSQRDGLHQRGRHSRERICRISPCSVGYPEEREEIEIRYKRCIITCTTPVVVKWDSSLQSIISATPPPDARSDPPGRFPCEFWV